MLTNIQLKDFFSQNILKKSKIDASNLKFFNNIYKKNFKHQKNIKQLIKIYLNLASGGSNSKKIRKILVQRKHHQNKRKNKNLGKVLFIGRHNCLSALKVFNYLKKKSKKVYFYKSYRIGENLLIKKKHLKCDYIFCFRSNFILKKKHIISPKYAAINFHPGTPKYRGSGCVNFAIYNQETFFGCTAHIINNELIDNGTILDVTRFKIKQNDNVKIVLSKTYKTMENQAKKVIDKLSESPFSILNMILNFKKEKWVKKIYKSKDLENLKKINLNINYENFKKKILATNYLNFKPYIMFKKKKFILQN